MFPLIATVALVVIGMLSTTWWGPAMAGRTAWALPDDLWGTLAAANRLLHLHLGGLYTQPTGLITLPGAAVILVPVAAVADALGIPLAIQSAHNPQPAVWLLAGPYEVALSAVTLFAADAIAEHLGTPWFRRAALTLAEVATLWSVSVRWGHPEDAMAVGLLLYAILALARDRPNRSAWLAGAAIVIQPLVLLAVPVLAMAMPPRLLPGFLARAAAPAVVAVGAAAAANWDATYAAVTSQPNFPEINHPTPWAALSPHIAHGVIAAGPAEDRGDPRGLRLRGGCRSPLARGPRDRVGRRDAARRALVGRVRAGAALRVRAGGSGVLPVARARGGACGGQRDLVPADRGGHRRDRAHVRLPGFLARSLDLVGADDALLALTLLLARVPLPWRRWCPIQLRSGCRPAGVL